MIAFFTRSILSFFAASFLAISLLAGPGCGGSESPEDGLHDAIALSGVNDFAYQLQGGDNGIDLEASGETAFDLVVIDYSRDGSEEGEFTADEITLLKDSSGGPKIVLAYLSIGEAEDYRFYFDPSWVDSPPSFLAASNPNWPGNYKVRYWQTDWQAIIFSYLDRIVDVGFDGIYLDIIDAYEFFGPGGEMEERPTAGADMIDFVLAIANYARQTRGLSNFLVFPQNGASILDEEGGSDYLAAVSGIGSEDTFHFGEADNDNELDLEHAGEVTPYLDQFVNAGKTVLVIDYVQGAAKVADFYQRCRERGYIPYATVRNLDQITINEGFEPD